MRHGFHSRRAWNVRHRSAKSRYVRQTVSRPNYIWHAAVAYADAAPGKRFAALGWRARTRSPARTRSHIGPSNLIVNFVGLKINLKLL